MRPRPARAGARHLLDAGARWLAFTDSDTVVSASWLVHQLWLGAMVVCGTVGVCGWESHGPHAERARQAFLSRYEDRDGHRHVHGANLGVDARAYRSIGGFASTLRRTWPQDGPAMLADVPAHVVQTGECQHCHTCG